MATQKSLQANHGFGWKVRLVVFVSTLAALVSILGYLRTIGMLQDVVAWEVGRFASRYSLLASSEAFSTEVYYVQAVSKLHGGTQLLSGSVAVTKWVFVGVFSLMFLSMSGFFVWRHIQTQPEGATRSRR